MLEWTINPLSLVCLNLYLAPLKTFCHYHKPSSKKEVQLCSLAKSIPLMKASTSQNVTLLVWSLLFIFDLHEDNINKYFYFKTAVMTSFITKKMVTDCFCRSLSEYYQ